MSLFNIALPPLETLFTYRADSQQVAQNLIGFRVLVPLGKRQAYGYVVEKCSEVNPALKNIKSITEVVGDTPVATQELIEFCKWISRYYSEPLSQVLDSAIPLTVLRKSELWVSLIAKNLPAAKAKAQIQIVEFLRSNNNQASVEALTRFSKNARGTLKALLKNGFIKYEKRQSQLSNSNSISNTAEWAHKTVTLSDDQHKAAQDILATANQKKYQPFLLHGVTGSGKTEVYLECIQALRDQGKGALVIVPEISLTPQVVDRFVARLGGDIAILHSALSKRERSEQWRSLIEGRRKLVIGVRSAVFAPVQDLGLIVIDEEHDHSFKQSDNFRYHARDLALVRAKLAKCPVVLGSATPALESYHQARSGRASYLSLPQQSNYASKVRIELVDLNRIKPWEMVSEHVSPVFFEGLAATIARGEQAFILYNRRGFASFLQCTTCQDVLSCPNCCVTLTLHKNNNLLRCHYCDYQIAPAAHCSKCVKPGESISNDFGLYKVRGAGTERIFDELTKLFPKTKIERLDRDSVSNVDDYRAILDNLRAGKTQILVGTQMIAKGHDLPEVTFVGVADSDVGLHLPDFRASERVFQLLTQVSGRAGRREKLGQVVLQTRIPEHHALKFALTRDYEKFALAELRERKALGYPPYARILRIVASAESNSGLSECLNNIRANLAVFSGANQNALTILGPAACPLEKLRKRWRQHLIVKAKSPALLCAALSVLKRTQRKLKNIRVTYDLDAYDML